MKRKTIIIIGAGLAGLATGCYAQMNGYESKIFEHHSKPGGVAAAWKRGEFLVDAGIHFLICHKPGTSIYDVYSEVGAVPSISVEDMTSYLSFVDESGNTLVEFTQDLTKLERDLLRLSPEDEKEIRAFIKEVDWMKNSPLITDLGMSTAPPELKGRFSSLKEMWEMRSFMKYFTGKFSKKAATYAKRFQSPILQSVFTYAFSPDAPVWFVIMILATIAAGQLGLLTKGCPDFVESIVKRYESLGGEIQYRATVEKIIVENDKAVGVLLSDETEHRADVVVSAGDGRSTIFELLEGKYVDEKTVKRYESWKPFDPTVIISYGVNRTFDSKAPFVGFNLKEPLQVGNRVVNCLPLRILNYGDAFAPPGKTVVQVMLETEWDYWNDLRQDREAYSLEKDELAQEVLRRLEVYYPGISSQIEMTDVASPYTTWRYTLNDRGSPMGWLITRNTLTEQIPRTLPCLENFYMAGHWVLPGGGVPGCIYTGRNVVQILCREDNREFRCNTTSALP